MFRLAVRCQLRCRTVYRYVDWSILVYLVRIADFGVTLEIGRYNKAGKMVSEPSRWGVLALNSVINLHRWISVVYVSATPHHSTIFNC